MHDGLRESAKDMSFAKGEEGAAFVIPQRDKSSARTSRKIISEMSVR